MPVVIEPQLGLERLSGGQLEKTAWSFQAILLDEQARACSVAIEPAQRLCRIKVGLSSCTYEMSIIAETEGVISISHHFISKAEASRWRL